MLLNFRKVSVVVTSYTRSRSPFLPCLSRPTHSGRWSSFGKRVWFTESHTVLVNYFVLVLFTQLLLIYKIKKGAVSG